MFCKVRNCRYNTTHVTMGHICGTCHELGHGQMECGNENSILSLRSYHGDRLGPDQYCRRCRSDVHTSEGHFCNECKTFGESCSCVTTSAIVCPTCRKDNVIFSNQPVRVYGLSEKCKICMENTINICLPQCRHTCMCEECFRKLERKGVDSDDEDAYIDDDSLEEARRILGSRDRVYTKVYAGQGCMWFVKRVNGRLRTFFMHGDSWGQYGEETSDVPRMEAFIAGMRHIPDVNE